MGNVEMDRITIKMTIIASLISALVLFILSTLWVHNGDIMVLKTNQLSVMKHIVGYESVPTQLARMEAMMEANARDHAMIMKRLDRR
jgi:hypothetical protein